MSGWTRHEGSVIALPMRGIDTDQLIPARFMSTPRAEGYGRFLLHDLRRTGDGELRDDLAINRHAGASVMVAGPDFGSGSSREAAVYALVDAGFRAVLAPSFGDIFAANAVNNGLLPARIEAEAFERLASTLGTHAVDTAIDLETCTVRIGADEIGFDLDPTWALKLRNGWDDIDMTGQHAQAIARFAADRRARTPWTWPAERVAT